MAKGKQKFSKKNGTYTDRFGETVDISGSGFTASSTRGLLAQDIRDLVQIKADNRAQFHAAKNRAIASALREIGLVAVGYAKRLTPVDTGRLRNSITFVTDDDSVSIGTNVEYALYVEEDANGRTGHHFLKKAAQDHKDVYAKILRKHMGG